MIQDGLQEVKQEMDAFLMAGQSNMSGRGILGEVPPIDNRQCYMLRMGRWQLLGEPVNQDRGPAAEFACGCCLATSFADCYQKATGRKVGMIPCADGGTTIGQWQPGEANFDHAIFQTQLAARSAHVKGILWHQGESDCKDASLETYVERFKVMISAMRKQLGNENLPVILGELSVDIPKNPRWKITPEHIEWMHANFRQIVQEVPNTVLVSSEGLVLNPDGIHFNSASLRILGERYFAAYKENFMK